MRSKEDARQWVIDAETACHPKNYPLAFTEIIEAKFESKNVVVARLKMFDGLLATLEVSRHYMGGYPGWGFHWRELPGGAIECKDGKWERVKEEIVQGVLF